MAVKKTVNKKPVKKVGRPSLFKPEYSEQAYKICLLGATDADLANFFDVNEDTINEWKKVHPEFSESLKSGKTLADAEIAKSLFHRAKGYEHPDVDIKMFEGQIIVTDLIKHYPPDTTAAIYWLKNRKPKEWRDKQEVDHTTNGNSINVPILSFDPFNNDAADNSTS